MNLWGGRFSAPPADALFALSRSIHFDWRLARYDIASSLAHLQSLVQEKIVSPGDAEVIGDALREISREIAAGQTEPDQTDEDVHSALERMLKEKVGEVGGALRAGRSRNDQIVTDLKLFLLIEMGEIAMKVGSLAKTILSRADECSDVITPGFTHLQHAQPVSFGQELAKHALLLNEISVEFLIGARELIYLLLALAHSQVLPSFRSQKKQPGFLGFLGSLVIQSTRLATGTSWLKHSLFSR